MSSKEDTERGIKAALAVAEDIASGKLPAGELDAMVAGECERLFGRVAGPGDPLWELQCQVARKVLGMGGIPANELAEWLAVTRLAEGGSWIERVLAEGVDDEDQ
ncbi:flagellar hook-length control protein [Mycobacterium sp. SM3041]|uniref:flagellar hook-length control protein n=1 Tax=Mycobacterium sp. SM3041 TaxID=3114291 RepID=UPI003204840B